MKSTRIASLLMIAVILLSIGIGSSRSLGKEAQKASDVFYHGVSGDGFSIENDLNSRITTSINLVTVAKKYLGEQDPAVLKLTQTYQELDKAKSPSEKYAANLRLTEAAAELNEKLLTLSLSEKDQSYRKGLMAELASYDARMSRNEYNQLADEYNALRGAFPANLLSTLLGIPPLEVFR